MHTYTRELDGRTRCASLRSYSTRGAIDGHDLHVDVQDLRVVVRRGDDTLWRIARARRVFVGESPLDHPESQKCTHLLSSDEGRGNTILVEVDVRRYVFIGCGRIHCFSSVAPMRDNHSSDWRMHGFVSPIGGWSPMPYPYAVDWEGRHYLLLEDVSIDCVPDEYATRPYGWFYARTRITRDVAFNVSPVPCAETGIMQFYLGEEEYTLSYTPTPDAEYERLTRIFGPMSVRMRSSSNRRSSLDASAFVRIMHAFGACAGFRPLGMRAVSAAPSPSNDGLLARR